MLEIFKDWSISSIKCSLQKKRHSYLLNRIGEENRKRSWNPNAVFKGAPSLVLLSERGPVGLVQLRNDHLMSGEVEKLKFFLDFVRQGGKLICLPVQAGFPFDNYLPLLLASGYTCEFPPENIRDMPNISLAGTDFHIDILRCYPGSGEKQFDFINCTWAGDIRVKRWDLALQLVEELCKRHTMALVAYKSPVSPEDMARLQPFVEKGTLTLYAEHFVPKLKFSELIRQSRVGIVASEWDARPRYLENLLQSDVPVVLNERIYGGKQCVRAGSGEIVPPERMAETAEKMLENLSSYSGMRQRYFEEFGPYNAARRFTRFINDILGTDYQVIAPSNMLQYYKPEFIREHFSEFAEPDEFLP
jgi:hypothetical protein